MRYLALLACLAACRPSDGAARTLPGSASATTPAAATASPAPATASGPVDSLREDSLLRRADAGRIQGSATAPVWLVEISDFQCPYCKQWHDEVYPAIKRDYIDRGIVRMAYVHLPLSIHPNAPAAAEASLCAAAEGRFWPVHDMIFKAQTTWASLANPGPFLDSLVLAAGVDAPRYRDCMRSQVMRRVITGDRQRATSAGVRSTPVFFIGDVPIEGLAPLDAYRQAIERARARAAGRTPRE
jgi:protein-disulfide isomerase